VPIIERKQGQVINVQSNEIQVMDLDTYDNFVMRAGDEELETDDQIEFLEHEGKRKIV
jgi:translation initiation factor 5A precursor (eIF-5A)